MDKYWYTVVKLFPSLLNALKSIFKHFEFIRSLIFLCCSCFPHSCVHSVILKYIWWCLIFYQTVNFYFASVFLDLKFTSRKTKKPFSSSLSILTKNHSTLKKKKSELSLKYSVPAIKRLKCFHFISKLKRWELNLLQKRAYSALKYMQSARGVSAHTAAAVRSGQCLAAVIGQDGRQRLTILCALFVSYFTVPSVTEVIYIYISQCSAE